MRNPSIIKRLNLQFERDDIITLGFEAPTLTDSLFEIISRDLQNRIDAATPGQDPKIVVLDCRTIEYITTAMILKLVSLHQKLRQVAWRLVLLGVPDVMQEVLEIIKYNEYFDSVKNEDELHQFVQKKQAPFSPVALLPTFLPTNPQAVLSVSSFHREIIDDLRWAEEQYRQHRFDQYSGQHIAILKGKVEGASTDAAALITEVAARHPGLPRERIALFFVDHDDWV